jgi:hypothetical protein
LVDYVTQPLQFTLKLRHQLLHGSGEPRYRYDGPADSLQNGGRGARDRFELYVAVLVVEEVKGGGGVLRQLKGG